MKAIVDPALTVLQTATLALADRVLTILAKEDRVAA